MAFDFDAAVVAPFRMQPGLRRLHPGATHLTPSRPADAVVGAKLKVLRADFAQAFVAAAGFDAAPAVHALAGHASAEHPDAFERVGANTFHAKQLGWTLQDDRPQGDGPAEIGACLVSLPPAWRLAGLLSLAFAEDLALIDRATGRIPWMAVCLPSSWAPEDKVGRRLAEIHAPVAENTALVAASDALLRLVTGGDRWERFIWTLTADLHFDRHPRRALPVGRNADSGPAPLAATTFFRTERQTFIPLPALGQAVFTIHVEVQPLAVVIASAARAARLHAALASMSAEVLAYRRLGPARDRLLTWLAAYPADA